MGIIQRLLGRNDRNESSSPRAIAVATPPTRERISYDQGLIGALKHDHVDLAVLFQRIGSISRTGDAEDIRHALASFKARFEAHLLTENVRFYTYLEQSLGGDAHNAEVMREFRRDMNTIARSVVTFVKRYQNATFEPFERAQFAQEHEAVGKVLSQRLDNEENSLYPLYTAA